SVGYCIDENNKRSKRIIFKSKSNSYLFLLPAGISMNTSNCSTFVILYINFLYFKIGCKSTLKFNSLQIKNEIQKQLLHLLFERWDFLNNCHARLHQYEVL